MKIVCGPDFLRARVHTHTHTEYNFKINGNGSLRAGEIIHSDGRILDLGGLRALSEGEGGRIVSEVRDVLTFIAEVLELFPTTCFRSPRGVSDLVVHVAYVKQLTLTVC